MWSRNSLVIAVRRPLLSYRPITGKRQMDPVTALGIIGRHPGEATAAPAEIAAEDVFCRRLMTE